jgi:diguanylate cyclase (GGDEF)-like protein
MPKDLPRHREWLRMLLDHSPVGFLVIDDKRSVRHCNAAAIALLGATPGTILSPVAGRLAHCDLASVVEAVLENVSISAVVCCVSTASRRAAWVYCSAMLLPDSGGEVMCTVWEADERQARYRAARYAVAGPSTRAEFRGRLGAALARAASLGHPGLISLLGLDRFQAINEDLGHGAADELLRAVGERLARAVRRDDLVARWEGDRFVVLLEGVASAPDAVVAAERLRGCFRDPYPTHFGDAWLTASIGLAAYPSDGVELDELLASAEAAMLAAKQAGHDRYRFFAPAMGADRAERHFLARALRGALERGEFSLRYQPEVRLKDFAAVGYEALLRWQLPERGAIAPVEFVPLAEECGLISEIGTWVLRTACATAATWRERHGLRLRVGVNLSAVQLVEDGLVKTVRAALHESQLAGPQLELEVTETALMVDPTRAAAVLLELRELGVRIALDDFGTGYSSLSHLRELPITSLKIDRSFVGGLPDDNDGLAITKAVIELARNLGVEAIAEGVETRAQLETIRELGCREGQGYLFSRPLPARRLQSQPPIFLPRQQPASATNDEPDPLPAPDGRERKY